MPANSAVYDLLRTIASGTEIAASQGWILSAMQKNGPGLVRMLWRVLGNEQDVCDAYQQTFLMLAHNNLGAKPGNIKAYLYRTAANTAISMIRHARREKQLTDFTSVETAKSSHEGFENQLDVDALQTKLRAAVSRLPEYLRNVIVLHDLAELSYLDVAKTLNTTVPTARVYRARAIKLLAAMMNENRKAQVQR